MDFSRRATELEWMDNSDLSHRELEEVMHFLSLTNRYLGGCRTILSHLGRWERFWQKDDVIQILDVGTGGADIPIAIHEWATARKRDVRITGIDKVPEIAEYARRRTQGLGSVVIHQADVFEWAAMGHSYDYVVGSLFLHHMPEVQIPGVLKCWDHMARRGLIVSDLVRSRWAYWSVKLLTRLVGNRIVQNDGPLSVLRSFSQEDLERYRDMAGLPYLQVRHHTGFRWTLSGEKGNLVKSNVSDAKPTFVKSPVVFSPGLSAKGHPL